MRAASLRSIISVFCAVSVSVFILSNSCLLGGGIAPSLPKMKHKLSASQYIRTGVYMKITRLIYIRTGVYVDNATFSHFWGVQSCGYLAECAFYRITFECLFYPLRIYWLLNDSQCPKPLNEWEN